MPATSKSQQRLMGWAYACKKGKSCPEKIKKIAKGMSLSTLKKFASTKHDELKENLIYSTKGVNASITQEELKLFLSWLDAKKIEYVVDEEEQQIEILQYKKIPREEEKIFLNYVNRLNLKKIWENNLTVTNNLSLISGQGNTQPPTKTTYGSGDRWDNEIGKKKKKKKKKMTSLKEFIEQRNL